MPLGQAVAHSPVRVQPPKPSASIWRDHVQDAGLALGRALRERVEVVDLRGGEEHRGAVGAGGHAGAAADALGVFEGAVGVGLGHGGGVRLGRGAGGDGDVAAGADDPVEGGSGPRRGP